MRRTTACAAASAVVAGRALDGGEHVGGRRDDEADVAALVRDERSLVGVPALDQRCGRAFGGSQRGNVTRDCRRDGGAGKDAARIGVERPRPVDVPRRERVVARAAAVERAQCVHRCANLSSACSGDVVVLHDRAGDSADGDGRCGAGGSSGGAGDGVAAGVSVGAAAGCVAVAVGAVVAVAATGVVRVTAVDTARVAVAATVGGRCRWRGGLRSAAGATARHCGEGDRECQGAEDRAGDHGLRLPLIRR